MKPSELPGTRSLYRLTNRALIKIRELWQYAGEDELPSDSLLQAQVEALRILHIEVPLSAKRQFQLFCSEHFPGLADIIDSLAADELWALLSMRVQLADSDQPHAQSAAVRFGGLGRRYVRRIRRSSPRSPIARRWIRPLSRGSLEAHRPFLGRDPPRLDAGHQLKLGGTQCNQVRRQNPLVGYRRNCCLCHGDEARRLAGFSSPNRGYTRQAAI